ncbi:hypothetical protein Bca101_053426 [Brassica carinata]
MARRSGDCMKCLVIFAVVSALVVCGPALYWKFNKGFVGSTRENSVCPPCNCDCPPPVSLLEIAPVPFSVKIRALRCLGSRSCVGFMMARLANLSVTGSETLPLPSPFRILFHDVFWCLAYSYSSCFLSPVKRKWHCGGDDPELKQEMEKQFVDLLTEELKLQEAVADEHSRHMNVTLAEAKRVASQYQKEAEKCNAATEICESARERAEALLIKERKITALWEKRARLSGWEGE